MAHSAVQIIKFFWLLRILNLIKSIRIMKFSRLPIVAKTFFKSILPTSEEEEENKVDKIPLEKYAPHKEALNNIYYFYYLTSKQSP